MSPTQLEAALDAILNPAIFEQAIKHVLIERLSLKELSARLDRTEDEMEAKLSELIDRGKVEATKYYGLKFYKWNSDSPSSVGP